MLTPCSALSKIEDNYFSLRDRAFQAWDDSYLRYYLQKIGIVDTPATAPRSDLLKTVREAYYHVDDSAWSKMSDRQLRNFLVKEKVLPKEKVGELKRDRLEALVRDNWYKSTDNLVEGWQQVSSFHSRCELTQRRATSATTSCSTTSSSPMPRPVPMRLRSRSRRTTARSPLARHLTTPGRMSVSVGGSGSTRCPCRPLRPVVSSSP